MPDIFFNTPLKDWLQPRSLPPMATRVWQVPCPWDGVKVVSAKVPAVFSADGEEQSVVAGQNSLRVPIDIFGSAFFLLTRYEERVRTERDNHERFPARASWLTATDTIERPLVNEYVEILWRALHVLWPRLKRKGRTYEVKISHDVDWPYCTARRGWYPAARTAAADIIRRRDVSMAVARVQSYAKTRGKCLDADLCNQFEFMMGVSEQHGLTSAFYFIAGRSAGDIDGIYDLDEPWMRALIRKVYARGHEVGLHPSYLTFRDPQRTAAEFCNLLRVCDEEGVKQDRWGGRQHYLRWENPETWRNWDAAGLHYDSTVGFADRAGFRCGTCYEFPVFDLENRKTLQLRERPLVVMDATLQTYMRLSDDQCLTVTQRLANICRRFEGVFTVLWHNNNLSSAHSRRRYVSLISSLQ